MLTLQSYLNDPCGTASIPYWKQKEIAIPQNMRVIHDRDYAPEAFRTYKDEPYFRLYHNMKNIGQCASDQIEFLPGAEDIDAFVRLINASYSDLSVTAAQMERCRKTPVYCPDLWVLLKERASGTIVAGGIADYDEETHELILEWIQVLPAYRGRGYGQLTVNNLLSRMQSVAKFATVSGKVNNPTHPEALYRKCGFTGNDIWHILIKR